MQHLETDYLIIGAGTAGLAFADSLLAERDDVHITIVDRHGKPGGHWNDAYPFVTLHQPSAFYGVNSLPLGSDRKAMAGHNQGLYELATGAELNAYFERVMQQRLLPTGRVSYFPMSNHLGPVDASQPAGDHLFESLLSGRQTRVTVRRKWVDACYYAPVVPSTHQRRFAVAEGATVVPPNALPDLWRRAGTPGQALPRHYTVLGAGKTAMDAVTWLLDAGAEPDHIQWVVPRDSWLINRISTQPGLEFFEHSIGGQALQMEAFAQATSTEDLFLRLEACGALLRIPPERMPTMFHLATVTPREVEGLRRVQNVVRLGRVLTVAPDHLQLQQGRVAVAEGTLFIDCTASAVEPRPTQPIFQPGRIVLQLVRLPQPAFSAALIARVEAHNDAHEDSDRQKNRLCTSVPFPHTLDGYAQSMAISMWNQFQWGQDPALRQWVRDSRLDGFGKLMASVPKDDAERQAILARFKEAAKAAMGNLQKLTAAAGG